MYGIMGQRRLTEWEAPWLPGYEGAQPVRIGNAAHAQLQLDVYGELMDVLHQSRAAKLNFGEESWALELALLDHLGKIWNEPDSGIWERRGPAQTLRVVEGADLGRVRPRHQVLRAVRT